jgi:ubiquinone/menaquinone biosynthesis C-methylase UbiE
MLYDRVAPRYDRCIEPLEKLGLARWRAEALSLLPENASVLELGAGTGRNFSLYPGSRLAVASEISIEMLRIAKSRAETIELVQADAQRLPFADNCFDAAFATLVFCSIPEPGLAFGEINRVVRPGGQVVLLEHVRPNSMLGYLFDALNRVTVAAMEDHFNRRTADLAAASGLRVVEVRRKLAGVINLIVCEVVK